MARNRLSVRVAAARTAGQTVRVFEGDERAAREGEASEMRVRE